MKITYLGTAAAEGAPAMFCHCENCEKFRKVGGRNFRARSQALIDGKLLVDFNADTYLNFQRFGLDLSAVKNIIVTHSHHDHFVPFDLTEKKTYKAKGMIEPTVTLYGNKAVLENYKRFIVQEEDDEENVILKELKLFESVQIDEYKVTPLKATHMQGEDTFIFLIEKDKKTILYCNDTGLLPKESVDYMVKNNVRLDFIGFDCTFAATPNVKWTGHMGLDTNVKQFNEFKEKGVASDKTQVLITHFSHWNLLLHDEMVELASKFGFEVAYDGISFEI